MICGIISTQFGLRPRVHFSFCSWWSMDVNINAVLHKISYSTGVGLWVGSMREVMWSEGKFGEFLSCCNAFDAWRINRVVKAATLRQRSLLQQQICSSSHIRDFFLDSRSARFCRWKKYLNELKMIYAFQFRGIYEFFLSSCYCCCSLCSAFHVRHRRCGDFVCFLLWVY